MNVLILSCDTGAGHNTTGLAVLEELKRRGHCAEMKDPFQLSHSLIARNIGSFYVKLVQKFPHLFGIAYLLGMIVTKLPFLSPVYHANGLMAKHMQRYLLAHPADVVVAPHLYPAEMLTYMKRHNMPCPKLVFIATDYACIPFTEETDCDYYVIPHQSLQKSFVMRGIPAEKLLPFGIPVRSAFRCNITKKDARRQLGLPLDTVCCLVVGGSMGAGKVKQIVSYLAAHRRNEEHIVVICGNNAALQKSLQSRYLFTPGISILGATNQMGLYMRACDLLYSKPGGLSSTEAAVTGIPLVHTTPIPGCETVNRAFFQKHGMSLSAKDARHQAALGLRLLKNPKAMHYMRKQQAAFTARDSVGNICDFIEKLGINEMKE